MPGKRSRSENELVGQIYDAALQPDGAAWQGVLETLRLRFNASSAKISTWGGNAAQAFWATVNIPTEIAREYSEYFHQVDVWTKAAEGLGVLRGLHYTDRDLVPETALTTSEIYNGYLKRAGIYRLMCGILSDEQIAGTPRVYLSLYRGAGAAAFEKEELRRFEYFTPHLRRANDIFWRLRGADLRHQADLAVLDRIATGVVLLNSTGEVMHTNQAAQRALDRNDGLGLLQRRLAVSSAEANAKLYRAIGQVCQTGNGNGHHAGGFLSVDRPSGKRPWSLLIAPLPVQAPSWLGAQLPAAIVFITDPEANPQTGSAMLAEVYGLTSAERRLLHGILQGHSAKEIAERHGVSFHTVRSQTKTLFSKTGVNRYGDLVRMAARAEGLAGDSADGLAK